MLSVADHTVMVFMFPERAIAPKDLVGLTRREALPRFQDPIERMAG